MRATEEQLSELRELAGENGGLITPALVLERATDPGSTLHGRFTWDDSEAARLRRLDEARQLIREVRVRIVARPDQPAVNVRAFVSLADDRTRGGGYREIEVCMQEPDLRAQLLRTAIGELQALQRKYSNLSELAQVFDALGQIAKAS